MAEVREAVLALAAELAAQEGVDFETAGHCERRWFLLSAGARSQQRREEAESAS